MKLKIEDYALKKLWEDFSEGIGHCRRVYALACDISDEDYDDEALFAACLLHNISEKEPYEKESALEAIKFLRKIKMNEESLSMVADAIPNHIPENKPETIEGKLLHDAHILDSIGCIGIISWAKEDIGDKKDDLDTLIKEVKQDLKELPKYLILRPSKAIFRKRAAHANRFLEDVGKEI
jgi:uncharacterized protein